MASSGKDSAQMDVRKGPVEPDAELEEPRKK